jgi:Alpha-mannosidase
MDFLDKRINVICEELKRLATVKQIPVDNWRFKKGNYVYPQDAMESKEEWKDFDCKLMHWYGPDEHYWFRAEFTVPSCLNNKQIWMNVRTQIDEWDDGKNPQFLLFLDNEPVQGIDMNHRKVLLTNTAKEGQTYHIDLQSYTGTLHTEFNLFVDILEVDPKIEKLYYDLIVPLNAFSRWDKDDKTRKEIEAVLNETINQLDLRKPYSELFYQSMEAAQNYIDKALYEDMTGYDEIIATCIGHTHIDVAWWWTVEQTREKVARSFATVLKLMEEYPDYKFMSSQPQLYYFLKERYPKLYEKVKERVKEGRWEPEGGMWVEADDNLISGESLVRQFIFGKKFFKEEFGIDNRVLWYPDVFGYSGSLPQIAKKCGIDYFMSTKLAWNQFNKMPNDTFMWRGIDGSEILAHFVTTLGVGQSTDNFFTTYNGMLHPDAIIGGWKRYQNKQINNDILVCYGYGDGGGGPTREMLETSKRMEKGIKGIPKVRQEFSRKYYDELKERVQNNKRLAVWEGELYFEYHRGTLTSMARNKRSNRKSELMLMDLELLSILSLSKDISYPKKELEAMWKNILLNQFHDILPGSSIKEVYEVTKKEYEQIAEKGKQLIEERLQALTSEGEGITIFNTLGFMRNDIVHLKKVHAKSLIDQMGNYYPIQQTTEGGLVYVMDLPSKGSRTYALSEKEINMVPFTRKGNQLETPFYTIHINEKGMITSLYDKEYDREVVQERKYLNHLRVYEDKPIYYDNWDIDIYYTEKFYEVDDIKRMEWTELGSVRAVLEIERCYSNSVIHQKIYFYANSRKIDFETYVDWKENQHLLKVHFPVNIHTDEATFDIQFGNLKRKVHSNTSWDVARFESCGHKWADLSEGHYGFSILNDCKYGHSVKDGNIALTLIKSGIEPNPTTDQEEHYFTYSIYPHGGDWKEGNTALEAAKLNQPAYVCPGGIVGSVSSFASVDKKNVMLETVKMAEDNSGIILRLYEYENALTKTLVSLEKDLLSVKECNLIEEEMGEIPVNDNSFQITMKPYEIKTFKVVFR